MGHPSFNELDLIQDPEAGLALLAKHEWPPERELQLQFWQAQFTYWRDWRAGDEQAIAHAVTCCAFYKRSPPLWLCRAGHEFHAQHRPDDEKREHGALREHFLRWEAVELVCGRRPGNPRNYKKKMSGEAVWVDAAKLVADTDARASAETVRKSHALVRHAGGALVTLPNYRREVEVQRRRREQRKNKLG